MTAWLIVHATTGGTTNVMAFVVGVLIVVALWFQIRELKHLYERRS